MDAQFWIFAAATVPPVLMLVWAFWYTGRSQKALSAQLAQERARAAQIRTAMTLRRRSTDVVIADVSAPMPGERLIQLAEDTSPQAQAQAHR